MPFIQYLPSESLENIILHVETPTDLLNLALTCKYLHDSIIPTYHWRLACIGCSVAETSSIFWQKFFESPRYFSMVRHIELCETQFLPQVSPIRQSPIVLMDEQFVTEWSRSKYHLLQTNRSNFQNFFQCLSGFINCQSITLIESFSEDEYKDILTFIAINLSKNLQSLVVNNYGRRRREHEEYIPRYKFSPEMTCPFDRLTTFHINLDIFEGDFLMTPIQRILKSLVFGCSTLVNFVLMLTCWEAPFIHSHLLESATWPSLKKLKLKGIELFRGKENAREIYISFLERHLQIESLLLEELNGMDNLETVFQSQLPSHVLPRLRSLHSAFPLHPDIFPRLHHISYLHVFNPSTYSMASSLRSCTVFISEDTIDRIAEAFPQLECLYIYLRWCSSDCAPDPCDCIFGYNLRGLLRLRNLTHLGMFAKKMDSREMATLTKVLIDNLPNLSIIYLYFNHPGQYEVVRNTDNGLPTVKLSKQLPFQRPPNGVEFEDIFDIPIKGRPLW